MNIRKIHIALAILFSSATAFAQTPVELQISHKLGGVNTFAFNQQASNDLGNEFNVSRIEYYISKISIKHDGGMTTDVIDHYILANGAQDVTDDLGSYNITNIESVSFYVGVDAPINHDDPSLLPASHPLAPKSPSMHWGWASGYRFVAMEGKSGAGLGQVYEIHALGDKNYFQTTIPVSGVMQGGKLVIPIHADYVQALKGIDISSGVVAHGEDPEDIKLLENFRDHVFSAGFPVSVSNVPATAQEVRYYPNPAAAGQVFVSFGNTADAATVSVADVQGRIVETVQKNAGAKTVSIQINTPGLYFVKTAFANGNIHTGKLVIQ